VVIGPKGAEKGIVELKRRKGGEKAELSLDSALAKLTAK
jgi:prolyl-tRNA synthetase